MVRCICSCVKCLCPEILLVPHLFNYCPSHPKQQIHYSLWPQRDLHFCSNQMIAINSIELRRRGREGSSSCCHYPRASFAHTLRCPHSIFSVYWNAQPEVPLSQQTCSLAWRYGGPPTSWTSLSKLQPNSHPSFFAGLSIPGAISMSPLPIEMCAAKMLLAGLPSFWSCTCVFHSSFLLKRTLTAHNPQMITCKWAQRGIISQASIVKQ